jgi:lipopolysaccharide export system protein LptC
MDDDVTDKQSAANKSRPSDPQQVPAEQAADFDNAALAKDKQALRITKALENAAKAPFTPLFGTAVSDAATNDALGPAPVDSDSLRGGTQAGTTGRLARPKRRRSFGLTFVKVVLPMIAVVTVGYLTYWWYVHNREAVINVATPDQPSTAAPMVTVNNFKYSATDKQNHPYTITADSAIQPQDKALDTVNLVQPKADFTLSNDHWMKITAKNGLYHRNADTIDLDGDVQLFHDNGMSFTTSHAQIDMKAKIAAGSQPVEGRNSNTIINSEGFRILDSGDVIIFTGKSKLQLLGKGKGGSQ